MRLKKYTREFIDKICLDLCDGEDGEDGRCQRFPTISTNCDKFLMLERAYRQGTIDALKKARKRS